MAFLFWKQPREETLKGIYQRSRTGSTIMSIGMLNLTTHLKPNIPLFRRKGWVKQDNRKQRLNKYFVNLEYAEIFWEPHKFNPLTNWGV